MEVADTKFVPVANYVAGDHVLYEGRRMDVENPLDGTVISSVPLSDVEVLNAAVEAGRLNLQLKSTVKQIDSEHVTLNLEQGELKIKNDGIIVCAGGILPTPMLRTLGIEIETKHGTL